MFQDTYIALRALIEYTNRKRLRDVSSLTVEVDAVALGGTTRTLHVDNANLAVMQSVQVGARAPLPAPNPPPPSLTRPPRRRSRRRGAR